MKMICENSKKCPSGESFCIHRGKHIINDSCRPNNDPRSGPCGIGCKEHIETKRFNLRCE